MNPLSSADRYFNLLAKIMMTKLCLFNAHSVGPGWLQFGSPSIDDVRPFLDLEFHHLLPGLGLPVKGKARERYRPALEGEPKGCHRNSPPTMQENEVKKFMFLSFGFEKPTPEIMAAWGKWFESIADRMVDNGHFPGGREVSEGGVKELPLGVDSITGFCIFQAENLDEAEKIAGECPYIASNRVYEIMTKK